MNFAYLLTRLKSQEAVLPLVFEFDGKPIGAGYHVTELRHSNSTGIDCGGVVESWQEARLQLLDGHGDGYMSVGKFTAILEKSIAKLPMLSDAELLVEYSPNNLGLKLMALDDPVVRDGQVSLSLRNSKAVCKPAKRKLSDGTSTSSCCGTPNKGSDCCASAKPTSGCC